MEYEFFIEGIELNFTAEIDYKVSGQYYRATLESPEEFPELEWWVEKYTYEDGSQVTDAFMLAKLEAEVYKPAHAEKIEETCWELSQPSEPDCDRDRDDW